MAKYKIVPKEVVKNIIEFLDEVQLEASKGQSVDDLHKINFLFVNLIFNFIIIFNTFWFRCRKNR